MKSLLLMFSGIILTCTGMAQYYYNDILSNQKLNREYAALKATGYQKIMLESYEEDDSPSEGFFCEKKFNPDFSESKMLSKSLRTDESSLKTTYREGRIVQSVNETPFTVNTMRFDYRKGKMQTIQIETLDLRDSSIQNEVRTFRYDSLDRLTGLTRSKDGKNISSIRFVLDDHGNIIEEIPENESADRKYYYYYDDKNRLTDVVHYNQLAKKLLPDYMFLYDDNDRQIQMITVDENAKDYNIWRYSYTNDGLPEIQKCFSKNKKLLGTIQFEYFKNL